MCYKGQSPGTDPVSLTSPRARTISSFFQTIDYRLVDTWQYIFNVVFSLRSLVLLVLFLSFGLPQYGRLFGLPAADASDSFAPNNQERWGTKHEWVDPSYADTVGAQSQIPFRWDGTNMNKPRFAPDILLNSESPLQILGSAPITKGSTSHCTHQQSLAVRCI